MLYRDFMSKYRPVYSPDEPAAPAASDGAAAAVAGTTADAAAAPIAAAAQDAVPAAAAPAADPAPVAEAPKAEPSLLEAAQAKKPEPAATDTKDSPAPAEAAADAKDAKAEGDKPVAEADGKKADGEAPKDDKAAAETDPAKKDATAEPAPPAPIKYDAFKVPDGIKLDDERIGKFTEVAGVGQVPQEVAQKLLDLHVEEMQRFSNEVKTQVEQHQRDVWNKLTDTWKSDARKDPQIGGNRLDTALARGKAVLEEYGGSPEQVRELIAHTSNNGMGNFPGFLRFLDNIAEALNIFEDSAVEAAPTSPKMPKSPGNRGWYDKSGMNGSS